MQAIKLACTIFALVHVIPRTTSLPIISSGYDTLPISTVGRNVPPGFVPNYYPDGKWPAYGWDAPANYHNYGKLYNDDWLTPSNLPRWYNQPDSTIFQGTAGFLYPPFYSYPTDPFYTGRK